jgi:formylmethanofuran dehydrogenase subunit C
VSWRGKLERADVEGGVWLLHARDGTTYSLRGDVPARLAGSDVVVEGVADDRMGIDMSGPAIAVRHVRKAP